MKEREGIVGRPEREHVLRTLGYVIRHEKKDGPNEVDDPTDQAMGLTVQGAEDAVAKGKKLERVTGTHILSRSAGSDRYRARITPQLMRLARDPRITGRESDEELAALAGETGLYDAVPVDMKLAMPFTKGVTPGVERIFDASKQGKLNSDYLAQHQEAIKTYGADKGKSFYAMQARQIGELILTKARQNLKLAQRYDYYDERGQAENNPEVYDAVEYFGGTHGGTGECFLMELFQRLPHHGMQEVEKLLDAVPNGFDYGAGFAFDITSTASSAEPTVRIVVVSDLKGKHYEFDETVPLSLIREIVRDCSAS